MMMSDLVTKNIRCDTNVEARIEQNTQGNDLQQTGQNIMRPTTTPHHALQLCQPICRPDVLRIYIYIYVYMKV